MDLLRLGLERGKTAREALEVSTGGGGGSFFFFVVVEVFVLCFFILRDFCFEVVVCFFFFYSYIFFGGENSLGFLKVFLNLCPLALKKKTFEQTCLPKRVKPNKQTKQKPQRRCLKEKTTQQKRNLKEDS